MENHHELHKWEDWVDRYRTCRWLGQLFGWRLPQIPQLPPSQEALRDLLLPP